MSKPIIQYKEGDIPYYIWDIRKRLSSLAQHILFSAAWSTPANSHKV